MFDNDYIYLSDIDAFKVATKRRAVKEDAQRDKRSYWRGNY